MTKAEAVVKAWTARRFRHSYRWGNDRLDYVEWDGDVTLRCYFFDGTFEDVEGWPRKKIADALFYSWVEIT